jgi:hypothetical protein
LVKFTIIIHKIRALPKESPNSCALFQLLQQKLVVNNLDCGNSDLTVGNGSIGITNAESDGVRIHFDYCISFDLCFTVEKNTGLVGFVSNLNGNDGLALCSSNGDSGSFSLIGSPTFAVCIILTGVRSIAGRNSRNNRGN